MLYFLITIVSFSLGFTTGSWLKGLMFDRLDWQALRWNSDCFGYRPLPDGSRIHRGEKVMMALIVDPNHWPEEGTVYGDFDADP